MSISQNQQNRFLPTTQSDRKFILDSIGVSSVEDLLKGIPQETRFQGELKIDGDYSELELRNKIEKIFKNSRSNLNAKSFIGAGIYDHFCPSVVNQLTLRGEFLTSYTPYQPEMSQGTLQSLFEFQSMVARIFQMDVSNASHYDGSTSCAEAALMSFRIQPNKKKLYVSLGVHPEYRQVIQTYISCLGFQYCEIPLSDNGTTSLLSLKSVLDENTAAVIAQSPNFFGCIEDMEKLCEITQKNGSLFCSNVTEPLSLALLKTPGEYNCDIATGEGQSFGLPQSFGGPYLGLFTTKAQYVRQLPGRLCGESVDSLGRRSYALTLSTREQHIRREKATSNICTNENLCALWSTIWLSLVGKQGFVDLAELNFSKAQHLKDQLLKINNIQLKYSSPTFNEFTVLLPCDANEFFEKCVKEGIAPGIPLSKFFPEEKNGLLINVTEKKSKDDLDLLCDLFKKFMK